MEQFIDQFFNFLFLNLHSQISALRLSQFGIFWQQDKSCCIKIVQVARKWKMSDQNYFTFDFLNFSFYFSQKSWFNFEYIKVGEIRVIQFWHNWYHKNLKLKSHTIYRFNFFTNRLICTFASHLGTSLILKLAQPFLSFSADKNLSRL